MEERIAAQRVTSAGAVPLEESVAVEAPLTISLNGENWVTTMRTPGEDEDLVRGLLYTEGIIGNLEDIHQITNNENNIFLEGDFDITHRCSIFLRSSSCGVCGTESLPAAKISHIPATGFDMAINLVQHCLDALRSAQNVFDSTGGVHAVALFTPDGLISDIAEDVGRHNAMDKVIGRHLSDLPLHGFGFLLSGRISYEMVQKAVRAGSPCIIAIGAPTTLAVDIARQHGITLIGFAREGRFNVYAGAHRLRE
jgi:FdhD protein